MKKTIIAITAMLGLVSYSAFGQGEVGFNNATATRISTNSVLGGPSSGYAAGAIGSFYYGLFVAPSTVSLQNGLTGSVSGTNGNYVFNDSNWTFTGNIATNTATAGRLTGNYTTGGTVTIPGYGVGSTVSMIVVGWTSGLGTDINAIRNWYNGFRATGATETLGFIGESAIATIALGGGAVPTTTVFGTGVGQVGGFMLGQLPVPEPSTFALAGLGAAAMLIFRRRK